MAEEQAEEDAREARMEKARVEISAVIASAPFAFALDAAEEIYNAHLHRQATERLAESKRQAAVAQLDSASGPEPEGSEFESRRLHQDGGFK